MTLTLHSNWTHSYHSEPMDTPILIVHSSSTNYHSQSTYSHFQLTIYCLKIFSCPMRYPLILLITDSAIASTLVFSESSIECVVFSVFELLQLIHNYFYLVHCEYTCWKYYLNCFLALIIPLPICCNYYCSIYLRLIWSINCSSNFD